MPEKIGRIPDPKRVNELAAYYRDMGNRIRDNLMKIDSQDYSEIKVLRIQKAMNELIERMDRFSLRWSKKSVAETYGETEDIAIAYLDIFGDTMDSFFSPKVHSQTIDTYIGEVAKDLVKANNSIKINVNTYLYLLKQANAALLQVHEFDLRDEEVIANLLDETIRGGGTRNDLAQLIRIHFKRDLYEKKFININGRNYNMIKYAKMVARTRLRQVQSESMKNTCDQYGHDLIKISDHNTDTAICKPFEGNVYSIHGKTQGYEILPAWPPFHPNSYSKDTEIYTKNGWQNIKELKIGDKCLSLNPNNLNLEYIKITNTLNHYQNKMIYFYNRNFDLLVTPDHNMFYLTDWKYKYRKTRFIFKQARELIKCKSGAFYRSSEWQGKNRVYFQDMLFEDYCKFMGYFLSEGSRTGLSGIRIAQFDEEKKEVMREDLFQMDLDIVEEKQGFRIRNNKKLNAYLKQFGKCNDKYLPQEIKKASPEYIRLFLDAYCLGDGSRKKGREFKNHVFQDEIIYFTTSKRMADELGELILKVGKRPSFYLQKGKGKKVKHKNGEYFGNYDLWRISECRSQFATLQNINKEIIDYNDEVYCVTLEKYHTLWCRRNGKTTWSGNCWHYARPTSEAAMAIRGQYA